MNLQRFNPALTNVPDMFLNKALKVVAAPKNKQVEDYLTHIKSFSKLKKFDPISKCPI